MAIPSPNVGHYPFLFNFGRFLHSRASLNKAYLVKTFLKLVFTLLYFAIFKIIKSCYGFILPLFMLGWLQPPVRFIDFKNVLCYVVFV